MEISKIEYICSIIENLGDFLNNIDAERKRSKKKKRSYILLKYSKQIYRVYYSLGLLLKDDAIRDHASKIYEIMQHRKDMDIENVDYSALKNFSVNKFSYEICSRINDLLA